MVWRAGGFWLGTVRITYRIAGNFRGRKLSRISRFFSHPRKFSPRNSRHATSIIRSVFAFREMLLSYRSAKVFSLENFPLYGIQCHLLVLTLNFVLTQNVLYIACKSVILVMIQYHTILFVWQSMVVLSYYKIAEFYFTQTEVKCILHCR